MKVAVLLALLLLAGCDVPIDRGPRSWEQTPRQACLISHDADVCKLAIAEVQAAHCPASAPPDKGAGS